MIDLLPEAYRVQINKEVLEEVLAEKKIEDTEIDAHIKAWTSKENEINKLINKRD